MLGWFRRHAKILMVVLGSSAMAIFGLGPVFDRLAQPGGLSGGPEQEVIATWKGGEITRDMLDQLRQRHYQTRRFIGGVQQAAFKIKGDQYRSLAAPVSPIQDGQKEQVDDQLITRFLMAERAKAEGVVASDGMVDDYIAMLSGEAGLTNRDLENINRVENNNYCSLRAVKEHLKLELLYNQMTNFSLMAIPMFPSTTEAIELHARTKNQIECEVLAVDVEEYLAKVTDTPPASELRKLYEAGKHEFPDPRGEKPGFKVRRKVNVQYFEANYQTYLQNEMNKLTDEEIQAEYDRLVEEKSPLVTEIVEPDDSIEINSPPPMKEGEEGGDAPSDVDAPPGDVDAPPAGEEAIGGNEEAPAKNDGSESSQGSESSEGEAGGEKQSLSVKEHKYQFVSTANQENEGASSESAQSESSEAPAAEQDAPEQSGDGEQGETNEQASDGTPEVGGIAGIEEAVANQESAAEQEPERKVKPLKDVLEDVKKSMVEASVNAAMEKALTKASVMVQDHFEKQLRYEFDQERGKGEEPAPLDVAKLATDYNLVSHETGAVDYTELVESTIGSVRLFTQSIVQGRQIPRLVPVADMIFDDFSELRSYDSKTANDNWGSKNNYLYWISEKSESRIPEYSECEEEVIKFWKKQKAYEMALAEADSIKQKVNEARVKKMSELYFERVFSTGAFSWFNNFGRVALSQPTGVTNAGDQFMQTAFSLEKMEAGIAPNQSRDKIYVIQSSTGPQAMAEIGQDYLQNQLFKFKTVPADIRQVSQWYGRELNMDWSEEFVKDMDLKYVNR